MSDLLERLEKATGGCAELDNAIYQWAEMLPVEQRWPVPHYTSSIDATLALAERVLPGWEKSHGKVYWSFDLEGKRVWVCRMNYWRSVDFVPRSAAPTLPLAICIAVLKAHEASQHISRKGQG